MSEESKRKALYDATARVQKQTAAQKKAEEARAQGNRVEAINEDVKGNN